MAGGCRSSSARYAASGASTCCAVPPFLVVCCGPAEPWLAVSGHPLSSALTHGSPLCSLHPTAYAGHTAPHRCLLLLPQGITRYWDVAGEPATEAKVQRFLQASTEASARCAAALGRTLSAGGSGVHAALRGALSARQAQWRRVLPLCLHRPSHCALDHLCPSRAALCPPAQAPAEDGSPWLTAALTGVVLGTIAYRRPRAAGFFVGAVALATAPFLGFTAATVNRFSKVGLRSTPGGAPKAWRHAVRACG